MQLEARKVTHKYGALTAVEEVDLTVGEGRVVALIGPSGCGKSTLLAILGGLLAPSGGQVIQVGQPPAGCLNPLTYVFQDFALLPWRSVAGNVALALEDHGLSAGEIEERTRDALARTKLSDFAQAFPRQLSGGMRQRVGIARALAVRPAVLLMDEPLSALDAQTRLLLMEDFAELWLKERTTAVYVTHNLDEALRLAHEVVVLSRRPGRVKAVVEVPLPMAERGAANPALAATHDTLWELIRDEAIAADRELAHE